MKNNILQIKKNRHFLLFLFFLVSFNPLILAQRPSSFVEDSIKGLKIHIEGINRGRLGDYEGAITKIQEVIQLYQKIDGKTSTLLASPYINMGIQYKNLGSFDKAIEFYTKAENIWVGAHGNDFPSLCVIYTNIGNIYRLKGDFNKALEFQKRSYRLLINDSIRYNDNIQSSKYNIAEIQLKLGNNKEAIRFAMANLKTTLPRFKPSLNDLIAMAHRNEGNYELADKYYLQSIKSWIQLYGEDNVELATEYLAYSSFLISQKQFDKAISYSEKAQGIVLKFFGYKSSAYSEVQSNFGDYYFLRNIEAQKMEDFRVQRKRNLSQALQHYQNAMIALVDSFDTKDPLTDPPLKNIMSELQLLDVLKKKASALEKLGDVFLSEFDNKNSRKYYEASLSSLSKSTELIHRLRIGFESEDSKLFLAENQESTFQDAIKISYKLFNLTKDIHYAHLAFEFSEKGKSANLLASVRDVKAKEFGGIPDSLLKRIDYVKVNIANYTSKLFEENHQQKPDSQRVNLYSSKIFKLNREHDQLIKHFEKAYPEYYSFKYENKITGIPEIQSKLRSRDALVEFVVNQGSREERGVLYRFVITRDAVDFSMENIDHTYSENLDFVHQFLTNSNYLFTKRKDFVHYSVAGYGLYEILLKPVSNLIKGKNLTIVPDGKLSYIPFDALISQMPDTSKMNFRNLKYLVRDYAINYSYSSTIRFNFQDQSEKGSEDLIAFSPEYTDNESRKDKESSKSYLFSPLPGAEDEVKYISGYINTVAYGGMQAQENIFKEKAHEFDVLHLAMHTVINDSLPMFSKLVFSNPVENSADDGFLNTYEIYNMKLKARLAVLSACETGSGKLQKGEGVMSLARGFIFAGCPSIVMTLWQVEDKSGVEIMRNFYSYLSKGKRKDVALQMAKIKHLELSDPLTAHPHYWLGYVNIGNPEALYTSKDVYFVIFLLAVMLLVYGDWYYRRKKPRKLRG